MATQPERIHRTFLDIPDEGEVSDETTDIHLALGRKGLEWAGLLESKRVLIFSQAGVGKTFECQAEQKRLWDEGEPAFFLELAQLAKRDFRAMLSPDEELRFDAWTASPAQYATFFLDSYDELLLTLGSFRQALTALARVLAGKLGRARIVVTSRPLPLDEQLFRQILPIPVETVAVAAEVAFADIVMTGPAAEKADRSARLWRRVILAPLNKAEMRQMAVALGVADPDALLADIRRRNAESFARRPQDLIDLCADWRSARRLHGRRTHLGAGSTPFRVGPLDGATEHPPGFTGNRSPASSTPLELAERRRQCGRRGSARLGRCFQTRPGDRHSPGVRR